jgi:uncharacterized protein
MAVTPPSRARRITQPGAPNSAPESKEELRLRILAYLKHHNTMTIASCYDNKAWAAAVFYASDGLELYFLTSPRSRHGSNIRGNATVSAAIHEDYSDWREIQGIQLEGRVEQVRSQQQKTRFWEVYLKKFPFVEEFFQPGALQESLQDRLSGIRLYRLLPAAMFFLDNSRGFGHREQLPL